MTENLQPRDLNSLPLVLPTRIHGLRAVMHAWAARLHISLKVAMECDAFHSTLQLVRDRAACTVLPLSALSPVDLDQSLRVTPIGGDCRRSMLLATAGANGTGAITSVLKEFRHCASQIGGQAARAAILSPMPPQV